MANSIKQKLKNVGVKKEKEDLLGKSIPCMEKNKVKKVDKCPIHPRYQGKRDPRAMCRGCWRYYMSENLRRLQKENDELEYHKLRAKK